MSVHTAKCISKLTWFLPAWMTCLCWTYVLSATAAWNEVFAYWPMALAMIAGSIIAGSTPLGGSVVAFPVAVLVLGFSVEEGRDCGVLIQSVGMNAAAYLIFVSKPDLVHTYYTSASITGGCIGVLSGLLITIPPFYVTLLFQLLVLNFAVLYLYVNTITRSNARPSGRFRTLCRVCVWPVAVLGGFLTAYVGSGADMLMYAYGVLLWNTLVVPEEKISQEALKGSSVVTMGALSIFTAACKCIVKLPSTQVLHCWAACAWIVCFGAPLGALLITPRWKVRMQYVFYALVVAQYAGFAALRIRARIDAWVITAVTVACTLLGVAVHARCIVIPSRRAGSVAAPV